MILKEVRYKDYTIVLLVIPNLKTHLFPNNKIANFYRTSIVNRTCQWGIGKNTKNLKDCCSKCLCSYEQKNYRLYCCTGFLH
jgi:hypothetical protein